MVLLGAGKTALSRHLLAHKPKQERGAILVNEFGEVGLDGALLSNQGAQVESKIELIDDKPLATQPLQQQLLATVLVLP